MISQDLINEALDTSRASKFSKPTEIAPAGGYIMAVKGVYARKTNSGTPAARVLLVHTGDNAGKYANVYLDLYKSKENFEKNSTPTERALVVIGDAVGLSGEDLQGLDFSVSGEEAAITSNGTALTFGNSGPEVLVYAKLDQETYNDRTRGVVKSIRKAL